MIIVNLLRKQIILLLGCCLSLPAFSQDLFRERYREEHDQKPYYFGLSFSFAQSYLSQEKHPYFLQTDSVLVADPQTSPGFALGMMATLHPFEHWEFRANPQLILGINRSFHYELKNPQPFEQASETKIIQSTIVSFPFSVKFNSDRIGNFRVYMLGGVQADLDLASNANASNAQDLVKLNKQDFGVHLGIGFNFYLPFVTVTPEIKFVNGLTNLHDRDANLKYSSVMDKMYSRMVMFSLLLE
jgi:hypothetical protein